MSNWLDNAIARAESVSDWLSPQRENSLALLRQTKWPNRKTEAWKYTPLFALEKAQFSLQTQASADVAAIDGLNSIDIVFVDGVLQSSAKNLPEGLSICPLGEAGEESRASAREVFCKAKPNKHLSGLVNDVLASDCLLIDVADGAVIDRPLRIVSVLTADSEAHTRVLVRVGHSSKVCVVEQYSGNQKSFNTGFAEYTIGEEACLEHYRFALQTQQAMAVGGSHFNLSKKAQLNSTLVGFGSDLSRVDVDVSHLGEHAFAKMNVIFLLDGNELFDLHSTIEHAVANGTTEENVNGIVANKSRAVFNGRIHIHRDAQKTLAELNNRNLLMSRDAEINTKPELEIYADDVRCAHGATIAEIDKKALYYLQSRGVSRAQAQIMLSFGFINELVDQMPNQVLAEWLRPQLRERFAQMEVK